MSRNVNEIHYPFPAIYGMEATKKALLCAVTNPNIKTILIKGASGTGKTLVARSLGQISGKSIVNVPLNVTDEQLFGCLDIEQAIKEGKMELQEGLFSRANGNILYMDDVNLFEQRIVNGVMDAVTSGHVKVERENISTEYDVDTILVATMNVNDSYLSPAILDHFDICVTSDFPNDADGRTEILRRNMEYESDPEGFCQRYKAEEESIYDSIVKAREILPKLEVTDELARVISGVSCSKDIKSSRGDLSASQVALTLAALSGRTEIVPNDIELASILCLVHRMKVVKGRRVDTEDKVARSSVGFNSDSQAMRWIGKGIYENPEDANPQDEVQTTIDDLVLNSDGESGAIGYEVEDVITKIGETFKTIDLFEENAPERRGNTSKKGKRAEAKSGDRSGRYVGSRIAQGKNPDMAFDATVRASAPYQLKRHSENETDMAVIIEKQDLREKIRESRGTATFLFAVDTSGSLIVRNRMMAVKGAILSLLKEHYLKKDRVGFMTFNEQAIEMLLPPSREVEVIYKLLDDLAIGRRTPLSAALRYLSEYMEMYIKKRPDDTCYVVLVTDGGANIPLDPEDEETDPLEEALGLAKQMNIPGVKWIVIDSEKRFDTTHHAKDFADALHAKYYTLDELRIETYEEVNLVRGVPTRLL